MKIQQLGRLTELPKVPEGNYEKLLILEDIEQYLILDGWSDGTWTDYITDTVTTTQQITEHWKNGFDAVLITFEPEQQ